MNLQIVWHHKYSLSIKKEQKKYMGMEGLFIKVSLQTIFKLDASNYFE
jgi:hypothetical protein